MTDPSPGLALLLLGGVLALLTQAGFALVEAGFARGRNAAHTLAMSVVVYPVAVLGFWALGDGLMLGGAAGWPAPGAATAAAEVGAGGWGLFGAGAFALDGVATDPARLAAFVLAAAFVTTAATIPTGAMAERWRLPALLAYAVFASALLFPLYGNWVWGGGWLAALGRNAGLGHGHVDLGGATVVHLTGGAAALAGTLALGPRLGKFRADGTVGHMPGHSLPMSVLGTFLLALGGFGLAAAASAPGAAPRLPLVAANALLASAAGAVAALAAVWHGHGKPDLGMVCNGLLGGLVAVSGACAFVTPAAAVLVGLVAGALVVASVGLLERRFRVDDPVGAVSVHGVCGAWGGLAVGLLADGSFGEGWNGVPGPVRGLLFGGADQLLAQLAGVATAVAFVLPAAYGFFRLLDRVVGNRVSAEVELAGLDALELGADAYPRG